MMWRGCIAPYDSNNKITTSFTRDYDEEDASSASFRFLHSCPTRVKNFLPNLLLENRSLLVDHLGALLHHRVGSPDLLAVVETLEVVIPYGNAIFDWRIGLLLHTLNGQP